jgi:diguanylate cyclase (GGDEF)-like protein
VGRYGGDEFIVVCCEGVDAGTAAALGRRIVEHLNEPVVLDGHVVSCRASVGVALSPGNAIDAHELVARADAAMYHAKRTEQGSAHLWTSATSGGVRPAPPTAEGPAAAH